MTKNYKDLSPMELLQVAINDRGADLNEAEYKLLLSGARALRDYRKKQINKRELTSINALIEYVKYNQPVSDAFLREAVQSHFHIKDIKSTPSHLYQSVVEYLVDFQVSKVLN